MRDTYVPVYINAPGGNKSKGCPSQLIQQMVGIIKYLL